MKRWEIALAASGAALITMGAACIHRNAPPEKTIVVGKARCRTPLTVMEPASGVKPEGAVFVLHGLSANRRIMNALGVKFRAQGFRVFLADLAGHGDNTNPFSFARAEECAQATFDSLIDSESLNPTKTIVIGHSLGGAFAIRMADRIPVAATIAISPAPMVPPTRMPANLLVFSAQFDVWQLRDEAAVLEKVAG